MKNLIFLPFSALFIFCTPKQSGNNFIGRWNIHHILINGKDITGNTIEQNMFNVKFVRTKPTVIERDSIFIRMDRNNKSVAAKITFPKKDVIIINSTVDLTYNASYTISVDTINTKIDGIDALDIQVILNSNDKTIYMNKYEIKK